MNGDGEEGGSCGGSFGVGYPGRRGFFWVSLDSHYIDTDCSITTTPPPSQHTPKLCLLVGPRNTMRDPRATIKSGLWIGSIEVGIKLQYERGRQKGKIGEAAARRGVVFGGRDQEDFEWGAPSTRCHVIFLVLVCLVVVYFPPVCPWLNF